MARNFRSARLMHKLKVIEAASRLGVSQPTLSAWETERKAPGIENLENMAEVYGVTTDYLLGRTTVKTPQATDLLATQVLPVFHGRPVWSAKYGWMLVNAPERKLVLPDGDTILFENAGELFVVPPRFAESDLPHEKPLPLDRIISGKQIWVEPISPDNTLRDELRGWYTVYSSWVENKCGNRFLFSTYGAKWLAFQASK